MTLQEAIELIRPAIIPPSGHWADIGAGTGIFTTALREILTEGKIIALDKNPHVLFNSNFADTKSKITIEIMEGDFNRTLDLPILDGIVMANALHYAVDHLFVLKNVVKTLKPGGTFILIEYETDKPNPPWVPNPIPFQSFFDLCNPAGLNDPRIIGTHQSIYSDGHMYVAKTTSYLQSQS